MTTGPEPVEMLTPGWLTRVSVRSLLKVGEPVGYRFLEQNSQIRREAYEYLRGAFPELKDANDDAVAAFVHTRALAAK